METATLGKGKLFGPASFYKKALLIALPVMLQMLIQNMVSLSDNFMVSGLGDVKMSGVNISGQILFVFMVLLNTICTAGGIFMSQYYGAGDKRGMRQALSFKAVLAAAAIVLYLLVCMVFPRQVLALMVVGNSQADAILDEAVKYMSSWASTVFPWPFPRSARRPCARSAGCVRRFSSPLLPRSSTRFSTGC